MDRTLSTQAKFESSNLGLILGTQFTPRGWIFWTIFFYHQKIQVKIFRISSYSFRGNYSLLNLTLCTLTFDNRTYRCGNYSRVETICGNTVTFSMFPTLVTNLCLLLYLALLDWLTSLFSSFVLLVYKVTDLNKANFLLYYLTI